MLKVNGINKLFSMLAIAVFISSAITAKNFEVGLKFRFTKISQALVLADNSDTIYVNPGVYSEECIIVTKAVTLIGKSFPLLIGNKNTSTMILKSNGVTVKGLHFKNNQVNFIHDNSALRLENVKDCNIEGNRFTENFFGIYAAKSSNCKIFNNEISASNIKESYSGNGIHLWYCREIEISNNKINGHRDGIYLEFVHKSSVKNNFSSHNLRYGLHFMFSDSCYYSNNTFAKNGAGVAVMYTHNVRMTENRFEQNWGSGAYGLLLKEISNSIVEKNHFVKNSSGIYLEGCSKIYVAGNNFTSNGWAIRLMANSMENNFEKNNFTGNTFDISTNSTRNYNIFSHNYWSEYKGYDLNKDGIGDVPYHPVKLFSIITEKNRPTLILLRSFFIELLNIAENIFPSLTPETLIDNKPSMQKFL
jgi:nitrous oxidase accessory protein